MPQAQSNLKVHTNLKMISIVEPKRVQCTHAKSGIELRIPDERTASKSVDTSTSKRTQWRKS